MAKVVRERPPLETVVSSSTLHHSSKRARISKGRGLPIIVDLVEESDDDNIEVIKTVKKRQVRFDEVEHEVRYFEPYPVDPSNDDIIILEDDDDENDPDNSSSLFPPSTDHGSKATAEYTVLSTCHGRARRNLRNICKTDLRAAIKYGNKLPAHPDRVSGAPRWKFIYNNVVYITDETCKNEITSYVEAIRIKRFPVTIAMMERNSEVKRILKEEPYLCTGHTYIIIDQSGSMRQADVNGFKDRSHAAFGTLALDFVAEQLSSYPNKDDLFAESVTLIEMRQEGRIIQDRQPFDWILFNRLLSHSSKTRPFSHGDYNNSLSLVRDKILKEYTCLLKSGVEKNELPHFTIVFLSDGRPSDSTHFHSQGRADILTCLATTLQSKFSFYAMGVGHRGAEFHQLVDMVEVVTKHGGKGQCVHAGLSAIKLSSSFSAISSAMTSVRSELLSSNHNVNRMTSIAESRNKVQKDFKMRETGKIVGKIFPIKQYIDQKGFTIKRFRFDKDLYKRKKVPWKDVKFAAHGANGFEIETMPFGKGAERLAFRFNEVMYDEQKKESKKVGKIMVAKNSILANTSETLEDFHEAFCRVQSVSHDLAEKFNDVVRLSQQLKPIENVGRPPELKFILCHVYTYKDHETNEETGLLVERFLPGKFIKYNSNNGYVRETQEETDSLQTIELKCGRVRFDEFIQAFSHWVYVYTRHEMIVCDIQGVLNREGRFPQFFLTDPAICTRRSPRFGKTDMKLDGIRNFCRTHRCGLLCRALDLPCMISSSLNKNSKKTP